MIEICQPLIEQKQSQDPAMKLDPESRFWLLATLAEAWVGLGDDSKAQTYLDLDASLNPPPSPSMVETAQAQLKKLRELIANSPLKA